MGAIDNYLSARGQTYSNEAIALYKARLEREKEEEENRKKLAEEQSKLNDETASVRKEIGLDLQDSISKDAKNNSYINIPSAAQGFFTNAATLGITKAVQSTVTKAANSVTDYEKGRKDDSYNAVLKKLEDNKDEYVKRIGTENYNNLYKEVLQKTSPQGEKMSGYESDFDLGALQNKRNVAWDKYYNSHSVSDRQLAEMYDQTLNQYLYTHPDTGKQLLSGTAQYIPQAIDQAKRNLPGTALALGAYGVGAYAGQPQIGAAAAKYIYGASQMISGAQYTMEQTRGGEFGDMLSLGIPEDIARRASQNSAVIQTIIEEAESAVDIVQAFKVPQSKTVTTALEQFFKNWGLNIITEGTEEGSQSIVGFVYEKDALARAGLASGRYTEEDWSDMLGEAWEEAKGGAEIGATMYIAEGLPHIVVGKITDVRSGIDAVRNSPVDRALILMTPKEDSYGNQTFSEKYVKENLVNEYDFAIENIKKEMKNETADTPKLERNLKLLEEGKKHNTTDEAVSALTNGLNKALDNQIANKKQKLTEKQSNYAKEVLGTQQEEAREKGFKKMEFSVADEITSGQKNVAAFAKNRGINVVYYMTKNGKEDKKVYKHRGMWAGDTYVSGVWKDTPDSNTIFVNARMKNTKNVLSVVGHEYAHINYSKHKEVQDMVNSHYTNEEAIAYGKQHGWDRPGFMSQDEINMYKEEMYADDIGEFLSKPETINMIEAAEKSALKEIKNLLGNFFENTVGIRPQFDSLQQYNLGGRSVLNGVELDEEFQKQFLEEITNKQKAKQAEAKVLTSEQKKNEAWYKEQKADNRGRDDIQKSLATRMNKGVNSQEVKDEMSRLEKKFNQVKRSASIENGTNSDYNDKKRSDIGDTQRAIRKTSKKQEVSKNNAGTVGELKNSANKDNKGVLRGQRNVQSGKGLSSSQDTTNNREQKITRLSASIDYDSKGKKLSGSQPRFYKNAYRNNDGSLPYIYIVTRARFLDPFYEFRSQEYTDRSTGFGNQNAVFGSDNFETATSYASGQITDIKSEKDRIEHPSIGGNNVRYNVYMNLVNPAVFDYRDHNFRHYIDEKKVKNIEEAYALFDVFNFYNYQETYDEGGLEKFISLFDNLDNNNYKDVLSKLSYKDFGYSKEIKYHFDNFINGIIYLIEIGKIDVNDYKNMSAEERELSLQELVYDTSRSKVFRTDDLVNIIIDYNYDLLDTKNIETAGEMLFSPYAKDELANSIIEAYNKAKTKEQFPIVFAGSLKSKEYTSELGKVVSSSLSTKGDALKIAINTVYDVLKKGYGDSISEGEFEKAKKEFFKILNYWREDHLLNMSQKDILDVGGFDGLVLQNVVDYGGGIFERTPGNDYVAFDSSQIKLVDNLYPTTNPDIRKSAEITDNSKKKKNVRAEKWKGKAKENESKAKENKRTAKGRGRALRWVAKKSEQRRKETERWKARTNREKEKVRGLRAKAKEKQRIKTLNTAKKDLLNKLNNFEKSKIFKFMTDEQKRQYRETFGNIYRKGLSKKATTKQLEIIKANIARELMKDPNIVVSNKVKDMITAPEKVTLDAIQTIEQLNKLIDAFKSIVEQVQKQQELVGLPRVKNAIDEQKKFADAVKELDKKHEDKKYALNAKRAEREGDATGKIINVLGEGKDKAVESLRGFFETALSTLETELLRVAEGNRNSPVMELFNNLNAGVTRERNAHVRLRNILNEYLTKERYRDLRKQLNPRSEWVDTGITVKDVNGREHKLVLDRGRLISLAMHSMQEQSLKHIGGAITDIRFDEDNDLDLVKREGGGLTVPDMRLAKQGEIARAVAEGYTVKLTPNEINEIVGKKIDKNGNVIFTKLTEEENEFIKGIQEFFEQTRAYMDEAYRTLRGYGLPEIENYFPIVANKAYIFKTVKPDDNLTAKTIAEAYGMFDKQGFVQERNPNTFNPIVLENVADVLTRMTDGVSKYYGYNIALHNNQVLLNTRDDKFSVEDALKRIDPKFKTNYDILTGFIAGTKAHPNDIFAKFRGRHAEFTLGLNPSSWVKQLLSVPTTMKYFTTNEMINFIGGGEKELYDTMKDYLENRGDYEDRKVLQNFVRMLTPDLDYRSGKFGLPDLSDFIDNKSVFEKIDILKGIARFDRLGVTTVTRMFLYAELSRRGLLGTELSKLSVEEADAVFQEVGSSLERFLRQTQPDYSQVYRANISRNSGAIARFITMYSTPSLQMTNNLLQSAYELSYALKSGDKEMKNEAASKMVKSALGVMVASLGSTIIARLFSTLLKGGEDDDYDFGKEAVVSMLAPTLVLDDLARGFMGMTTYESQVPELIAYDAIVEIASSLNEIATGKPENAYNKWKKIVTNIGLVTGIPLRDLYKIAKAVLMYADSDLYYSMSLKETPAAYKKWIETEGSPDIKDYYRAYTNTRESVLKSKYGYHKADKETGTKSNLKETYRKALEDVFPKDKKKVDEYMTILGGYKS